MYYFYHQRVPEIVDFCDRTEMNPLNYAEGQDDVKYRRKEAGKVSGGLEKKYVWKLRKNIIRSPALLDWGFYYREFMECLFAIII